MHSVPQRHSATAPQRHSATATFGLALLIQTSVGAFWVVKLVGAAYLVWLGVRALLSRDLVTLTSHARRPLKSIFLSGLVSKILKPKIGFFVLGMVCRTRLAQSIE